METEIAFEGRNDLFPLVLPFGDIHLGQGKELKN